MQSYTTRKGIIFLFVVAYGLVAYLGGKTSPRGEYFPVFNWSLFTHVAPVRGLLEVHVSRIGDRVFEQPVNFFELDQYFPTAQKRSTDLKKTLEQIARAAQRGDEKKVAALRGILEQRHLGGHGTVAYEIRYVVFRPLERWKTGRVMRQRVLASFETGGPS
jgi:hypothetical protein